MPPLTATPTSWPTPAPRASSFRPAGSVLHPTARTGEQALVIALSLLVAGYVQGVLWAQGVRSGVSTFAGNEFVDVTDAIRPLLWLRVIGEALVMLAWVTAFQQVFSTSTADDAEGGA